MSKHIFFKAPVGSTLNHGGKTVKLANGDRITYDVAVPYDNDESRQSAIDTYQGLRKCEIAGDVLSNEIVQWPTSKFNKPTQRYHEPSSEPIKPSKPIMGPHL